MEELKTKIGDAVLTEMYVSQPENLLPALGGAALRAIEEAGYAVVPRSQWAMPMPHPMVSSDEGYDPMTPDEIAAAKEKLRNLEEPRG